ncbi:uncharacterized protein LOC122089161 [Macadamia integrifolia]|uniref:uncharacterized protein LOC122089161 n=1 Tax=Macadamia integrifolia TaxID=60698 RepID=UPI001C4E41F6|nr:uncharacterized protein LOC122089161 [Macadamia integrifolia]
MGAMSSVSSLALVAFVIAGFFISGELVSAQGCGSADYKYVMMLCLGYIEKEGPKSPPSGDCCDIMKRSNLRCVCEVITLVKDDRHPISRDKMVYVANYCGTSIPPGIPCGS